MRHRKDKKEKQHNSQKLPVRGKKKITGIPGIAVVGHST
jgi:hypothetical protein